MALMAPDRIVARHAPVEHLLEQIGAVTTGQLLTELAAAAQVLADAHDLPVDVVRALLIEWEVHRPTHP